MGPPSERAIETRPSDAGIYNAYATLSKDLGDVEGARRLYALGTKANRYHLPTYQAWGLMEASISQSRGGGVERAREVFQQGVWAAPRGKGVSKLWQAWALMEANHQPSYSSRNQRSPPSEAESPVGVAGPGGGAEPGGAAGGGAAGGGAGGGGNSGENSDEERMLVARKYFQYALDAEQQAYPTGVIIAWAKTEERFGFPDRARALFEEAVRADETNRRLWTQYEQFEGRQQQFAKQQLVNQR